jgi:hypothetical protein
LQGLYFDAPTSPHFSINGRADDGAVQRMKAWHLLIEFHVGFLTYVLCAFWILVDEADLGKHENAPRFRGFVCLVAVLVTHFGIASLSPFPPGYGMTWHDSSFLLRVTRGDSTVVSQ